MVKQERKEQAAADIKQDSKNLDTYSQLIKFLDKNKAKYRLIDHPPEGRTEIVSPMRGNKLSQAAKCIVMMVKIGKKEKKFVLGVVPGDANMDLDAVKALFQGTYISFATKEIAEKLAGSVAGTVLPFSFNPELELIVDPTLLKNEEIFFNAARLDRSMALKTKDYERFAKPRLENISKYSKQVKKEDQKKSDASSAGSARADVPENTELHNMRHSCAHMLAQAVLEMFPEAKLAIGPTIENGFYYDFDLPRTLIPEDLEILQEKMERIANERQTFERREEPVGKAIEFYKKAGQPYKAEIADDLKNEGEKTVTCYENRLPENYKGPAGKPGDAKFSDLCRGGHSENTGKTGVFKLHKIAGAYWRGDEKRPMLQRIYGLCFQTKQELADYLQRLEEAKKRDHRKLGKELKIFTMVDEIGPGLAVWLPNGTIVRDELEKLAKEEERRDGYVRVATPHITKGTLYHRSGHLPYYKDTMYPPMMVDEEEYYLKPMNCPMHHMIYLSEPRSYRDLPLRLAEYGQCYRYEKSGELNGLMRVRAMAMNDAHIYCRKDQIKEEFIKVMRLHERHYKRMGITEFYMRFSRWDSTRKEKYIDQPEHWDFCEKMMMEAMNESGIPYVEVMDEAAFYGPKIDFQIKNVLGNEYSISTNQLDFAAGDRFGLRYVDAEGKEEKVFVIHRAPLGTHERFIAFLLEHFGGAFPVWLAPMQVAVLPVSDKHLDYAREIYNELFEKGVRVSVDDRTESLGKKIRAAELSKVPYMLVVGDKEVSENKVAVRSFKTKEQATMGAEEFGVKVFKEILERVL